MAELTPKKRKKLKTSQFAIKSERAYPINDLAHAKAARSRVMQHGTPEEQKKVFRATSRKFPELADTPVAKKVLKKKGD